MGPVNALEFGPHYEIDQGIREAFRHLPAYGGEVYLDPGRYTWKAPVKIEQPNTILRFAPGVTIEVTAAGAVDWLQLAASNVRIVGGAPGMTVSLPAGNTGAAVRVIGGAARNSIWLTGLGITTPGQGIVAEDAMPFWLQGFRLDESAIAVMGASDGIRLKNVLSVNCTKIHLSGANAGLGLRAEACVNTVVQAVTVAGFLDGLTVLGGSFVAGHLAVQQQAGRGIVLDGTTAGFNGLGLAYNLGVDLTLLMATDCAILLALADGGGGKTAHAIENLGMGWLRLFGYKAKGFAVAQTILSRPGDVLLGADP